MSRMKTNSMMMFLSILFIKREMNLLMIESMVTALMPLSRIFSTCTFSSKDCLTESSIYFLSSRGKVENISSKV
jgi:hypothetical protein